MSNMSYCRFENTYRDLKDCHEHLGEPVGSHSGSHSEDEFRAKMIELCQTIVTDSEDLVECLKCNKWSFSEHCRVSGDEWLCHDCYTEAMEDSRSGDGPWSQHNYGR